ncbi:hypothetical protein CEP52_007786 [Fusarium oligoseptatum]|uniref:Uncharacterized protein n=1 Tax=Fusarium oligoseptatum TaxID=2604345 RepID=A0A428TKX7_9HYPO|nr:hypothetical protein CEP52_007786 [Fusarium oligoseptatum]
MAPDRITNAIDSLITHLVPSNPNDTEEVAQERHDTCFEIVKSIIDSPSSPAISSDVNHASDLIKRKLIQSNPTQALRFSNLYTRLLSLPVLEHKWAILYLLYQLADSPDPSEPLPLSPVKPSAPNYRDAINRDAIKTSGPGACYKDVQTRRGAVQGGVSTRRTQEASAKRTQKVGQRWRPTARSAQKRCFSEIDVTGE